MRPNERMCAARPQCGSQRRGRADPVAARFCRSKFDCRFPFGVGIVLRTARKALNRSIDIHQRRLPL
jgi:hypothetical protein